MVGFFVDFYCIFILLAARVRVDSLDKVAEIEKAEKGKMKSKVDKILKHQIK
jgi:T-complex protein 1 subunit beta